MFFFLSCLSMQHDWVVVCTCCFVAAVPDLQHRLVFNLSEGIFDRADKNNLFFNFK